MGGHSDWSAPPGLLPARAGREPTVRGPRLPRHPIPGMGHNSRRAQGLVEHCRVLLGVRDCPPAQRNPRPPRGAGSHGGDGKRWVLQGRGRAGPTGGTGLRAPESCSRLQGESPTRLRGWPHTQGFPAEGRPWVRHGAPPTEGPLTSRGLCHLGPATPTLYVCVSRGRPCGSGRDLEKWGWGVRGTHAGSWWPSQHSRARSWKGEGRPQRGRIAPPGGAGQSPG